MSVPPRCAAVEKAQKATQGLEPTSTSPRGELPVVIVAVLRLSAESIRSTVLSYSSLTQIDRRSAAMEFGPSPTGIVATTSPAFGVDPIDALLAGVGDPHRVIGDRDAFRTSADRDRARHVSGLGIDS